MQAIVEGGQLGASFFIIIIYALRKPHESAPAAAALPRLTITCVLQVRVGDYANASFVSALSLFREESGAAESTPRTLASFQKGRSSLSSGKTKKRESRCGIVS